MGFFTDQLKKIKKSLIPKPKSKPMVFTVGEGLTPEQTIKANETVRKVDQAVVNQPFTTKGYYQNKLNKSTFGPGYAMNVMTSPNASKEEKKAALEEISSTIPIAGSAKVTKLDANGKVSKSLLNWIAKTKVATDIQSTLKKAYGLADDVLKPLSERLAATKSVNEVKNVLGGMSNVPAVVPKKPPVTSKIPLTGTETPAELLAKAEADAAAKHGGTTSNPTKYKSVDEFMDGQGETVYRGGGEYNPSKIDNNGIALTTDVERAKFFTASTQGKGGESGRFVQDFIIEKGANIANKTDVPVELWKTMEPDDIAVWAKKNGYDGIDLRNLGGSIADADKEIRIFNPDILKTKSQLTDIWNKANTPNPAELEARISILEDVIANHPGQGLVKYVSRSTGRLPEVTGKTTMKAVSGSGKDVKAGKWNKSGDELIDELGVKDLDEAQVKVDEYKALKKELSALKSEVKSQKTANPAVQPAHLKFDSSGKPLAYTAREQAIVDAQKKSVPFMPKAGPAQTPSPQISKLDTTTGEGRSIEKSALQEEAASNQVQNPPNDVESSLIEMIQKEPTSVKNKVNVIDYIRTPELILKKIGLEKEGDFLRSQYNKYEKELPKNIEKITQWAKRASKNGNRPIFRWLDGEAIDLLPQDKEIAIEIKAWLEQWADRLGLPKDDRIAYYITHIFDNELVTKEFPEELAKIIDNKLPSEVYDPFLQKRLGKLGYKQDTWAALDAYAKRATRKVHMDPALERVKKAGEKLEKSQLEFVQEYVNGINMRPGKWENLIDNGIKQLFGYRFGARPTLSITSFFRKMTYRAMLGLNPASALKNISQGINTYAVLGEKYTTLGYIKLFNKGAKAELEAEGILNAGFIEDRALSATKKFWEKFDKVIFYLFEKAEHINRGAAYFGAKSQGIAKGMTEREAINYAKKIVRKTQFAFGKIDTPLVLSGPIGKTVGQFQSFSIKQTEFLLDMIRKAAKGEERAKNIIGLLRYAMAGIVFVYTIGKAFNMKISDLVPKIPFIQEGKFGTPPSIKFPIELGKAIFNTPDKYGNDRDLGQKAKDVGNTLWGIVPGGIQAKKTIQGYKALKDGKATDASGRSQYDVGGTPAKDAQALIFGKYAGQGAQDYYENDMTYAEATLKNLMASPTAAEDFIKMIEENPALADQVVKAFDKQALGITEKDQKLLNMGVATKQRAKEVARQINKLNTPEEKQALVIQYIEKKIITDDVADQLIEFLK